VLSLPRRLALLEWARRHDAWILEDDYDGEFNYDSRPLAALKSLDRDDRVLYLGTFSKVLFPRSGSATSWCRRRCARRWSRASGCWIAAVRRSTSTRSPR
jgi:DNA-binding transcriptional MocR family regulator